MHEHENKTMVLWLISWSKKTIISCSFSDASLETRELFFCGLRATQKKHSMYWRGKSNPTSLLFVRTGTRKGRLGSIYFNSNYICDWVMILTQKAFKCRSNFSRPFEKDVKDKYCLEKNNLLKYFFSLNLFEDISSHQWNTRRELGTCNSSKLMMLSFIVKNSSGKSNSRLGLLLKI